jgi:flagellar basal-body rod modification protein FlgD
MNTVNSFNEMLGIPASGQPAPRGSNELGQADFLELMVAQLKNQDPTKPMDNSEFLSQMAQFSMVNGIEGLNTSFSSVSESILGSQGLQAATLLDRQALVDSPWGHFDGATSVAPNGQNRLDFEWDGLNQEGEQVAAGSYHITAVAAINGVVSGLPVITANRIDSVSLDQATQQVTLNLANGQTVRLGEVREYR